MCNSRRLFGDLAEWTWGSASAKWRLFGDLAEWTWGTGPVWRTFGAEGAPSGCPGGERVAPFPKRSHSCGYYLDRRGAGSPKALTVVLVRGRHISPIR